MSAIDVLNAVEISIHAAREGGDSSSLQNCALLFISIHAAREGGDAEVQLMIVTFILFQSTPPVKAATAAQKSAGRKNNISIHAAREGGDLGKAF